MWSWERRLLLEMGPKIVFVTLGEQRRLLRHAADRRRVPTIRVTPVDVTGAGDGFVAGFLRQLADRIQGRGIDYSLSMHEEIEEMTRYGVAVGALTVSKMGAIPALPTKEEVYQFMYRGAKRNPPSNSNARRITREAPLRVRSGVFPVGAFPNRSRRQGRCPMSSSMESFLAFIFQFIWPGAILAAITAAVAIWRRQFIWLLISTLCLTPFLFYLGMTPRFTYAPYFLILHAFAILNMRRSHVKVLPSP